MAQKKQTVDDLYQELTEAEDYLRDTIQFYEKRIRELTADYDAAYTNGNATYYVYLEIRNAKRAIDQFTSEVNTIKADRMVLGKYL